MSTNFIQPPPLTQNTEKTGKILFVTLMILSALFYGFTIFSHMRIMSWDADMYRELGVNLRVHGVYGFGDRPTAYRPPLYPILLAAVSYGTGLLPDSVDVKNLSERLPNQAPAILHFLLAILTVALTYRIGRRIGFTPWFATVAGLLVLIDQSLLFVAYRSITELTATFLMVLVIERLLSLGQTGKCRLLKMFIIGLIFGMAALCRPTFLAFGLLCFPFIVLLEWLQNHSFRALLPGILLMIGVACFIVPWGIRNQRHFGRFIPTTTHGGVTLFMVNNDPYYDSKSGSFYIDKILNRLQIIPNNNDVRTHCNEIVRERENAISMRIFNRLQIPFDPVDPEQDPKGFMIWRKNYLSNCSPEQELMLDDAYYYEAKQTIAARKIDFIKVSFMRVVKLWYPPEVGLLSMSFYLYVMEFLLMFCGILSLARKGLLTLKGDLSRRATLAACIWFILAILSIQLPHLFYNVDSPRMRVPLLPVIVLLAVYGLCSLVRVYRKRRRLTEKKPEV